MPSLKQYRVAVVGVSGVVGREMISLLQERRFPVRELVPFASERSEGQSVLLNGSEIPIKSIGSADFHGIDLAFFSAGSDVSREYAPKVTAAGGLVIDNTSAFRMEKEIPLIVPEVNPDDIALAPKRHIIANPNCSTIQMVVVLHPLHQKARITRGVVATYQAVSGAGSAAIEAFTKHHEPSSCIPHIDLFDAEGNTKEEIKMRQETKKIMHDPQLEIAATCVRVPVINGHAEAVHLEFETPMTPLTARALLQEAPGVQVIDSPSEKEYPLQAMASGHNHVFVGRIRKDSTVPHGLALWIVADNLRKGAALNSIQIAELAIARGIL